MDEIIIRSTNGELTCSSLDVAKDFGKEHRHVIEVIENLTAENSAVKNLFIKSSYINERGREYKSYEITRDGFTLLVMGFTGRKALEWKLKYIEAFNLMEKQLKNGCGNVDEIIAKAVSSAVSETIKALVPMLKQPAVYPEPVKRICKKYRHTTPSKISTLPPELKTQVDKMIVSGEYSCQEIANFIMNNSNISISQMAVNRYKHNNFIEYDNQLTLF